MTVHRSKIHTVASIAAGAKHRFQWNNPPAGVIAYYIVPNPPTPSGEHGVTRGTVEMGRVTTHRTKDNHNAHEASYAAFDIVNTGDGTTAVDIYQTWVD